MDHLAQSACSLSRRGAVAFAAKAMDNAGNAWTPAEFGALLDDVR
jgi:hypothetical protein